MSELADLVSRISGNLKYWFAHILVKDSAIVDQNISFSWLVSVLMISIPYVECGASGDKGMPDSTLFKVYAGFWVAAIAVSVFSIASWSRLSYRLVEASGADLDAFRRAEGKAGILVMAATSTLFALSYAVLPSLLGAGVETYIWMLGVGGALVAQGLYKFLLALHDFKFLIPYGLLCMHLPCVYLFLSPSLLLCVHDYVLSLLGLLVLVLSLASTSLVARAGEVASWRTSLSSYYRLETLPCYASSPQKGSQRQYSLHPFS